MTPEQAVAALDAIDGGDPEVAHGLADDLVPMVAPAEVREAYLRLMNRCRWWACA